MFAASMRCFDLVSESFCQYFWLRLTSAYFFLQTTAHGLGVVHYGIYSLCHDCFAHGACLFCFCYKPYDTLLPYATQPLYVLSCYFSSVDKLTGAACAERVRCSSTMQGNTGTQPTLSCFWYAEAHHHATRRCVKKEMELHSAPCPCRLF